MPSTIPCGAHVIEHAKLTGSSFVDVCLGDSKFDNVSFANASLHDVNMAGAVMDYVNLEKTKFVDCHLVNVEISNSRIDGMKIDGIPVAEALRLYREGKSTR